MNVRIHILLLTLGMSYGASALADSGYEHVLKEFQAIQFRLADMLRRLRGGDLQHASLDSVFCMLSIHPSVFAPPIHVFPRGADADGSTWVRSVCEFEDGRFVPKESDLG